MILELLDVDTLESQAKVLMLIAEIAKSGQWVEPFGQRLNPWTPKGETYHNRFYSV